jgi:hypothetical protein
MIAGPRPALPELGRARCSAPPRLCGWRGAAPRAPAAPAAASPGLTLTLPARAGPLPAVIRAPKGYPPPPLALPTKRLPAPRGGVRPPGPARFRPRPGPPRRPLAPQRLAAAPARARARARRTWPPAGAGRPRGGACTSLDCPPLRRPDCPRRRPLAPPNACGPPWGRGPGRPRPPTPRAGCTTMGPKPRPPDCTRAPARRRRPPAARPRARAARRTCRARAARRAARPAGALRCGGARPGALRAIQRIRPAPEHPPRSALARRSASARQNCPRGRPGGALKTHAPWR